MFSCRNRELLLGDEKTHIFLCLVKIFFIFYCLITLVAGSYFISETLNSHLCRGERRGGGEERRKGERKRGERRRVEEREGGRRGREEKEGKERGKEERGGKERRSLPAVALILRSGHTA